MSAPTCKFNRATNQVVLTISLDETPHVSQSSGKTLIHAHFSEAVDGLPGVYVSGNAMSPNPAYIKPSKF